MTPISQTGFEHPRYNLEEGQPQRGLLVYNYSGADKYLLESVLPPTALTQASASTYSARKLEILATRFGVCHAVVHPARDIQTSEVPFN